MIRKRIMASYGTGKFLAEFLTGAYGAVVYKYYETEVGLAAGYVAVATIIYSLWNAVNDPLIGYLTSKKTPGATKFGRRFSWIILGIILASLMFLGIFALPRAWSGATSPVPVFLWMVIAVCLYDASYSLWELNYQSVYPDKFRSTAERTKAASIGTIIGVFGVAAGFIIPPLFFTYGDRASYSTSAMVIAGIGILCALLIIPGVRETSTMIERYRRKLEDEQANRSTAPSFFAQLKTTLSDRNMLAFVLFLFFYQSGCILMTGSVHYVGNYILGGSSSDTTLIFAGMLIGALVSIPIWARVSKKLKNNQKMLCITGVVLAVTAFPMTFVRSMNGYTLFMTLWGIGFGGFWTFMSPAMADVVDWFVVKTGRRDDGVIMGMRAFFMRFSYASQAIVFWLTHKLTAFDATITDPALVPESMKFGISLHMAAIPALFFLIGVLVFIRLNRLTPKTVEANRLRLSQMDL